MRGDHFSPDIQEFFILLVEYSVEYVIVGGEAVIYYGFARLTGDVDIFYRGSSENVAKLYGALKDFWRESIPGISNPEELLESDAVFQFGVPPNRINLISRIDGVTFEEVWEGKESTELEVPNRTLTISFIGLDE